MKILCIADLHYVSKKDYFPIPERKYNFGLEFLERVLRREKGNFDVLIIYGDFIDNSEIDCAENDFLQIKKTVENEEIPCVFVRGNHDIEMLSLIHI